LLDAAGRKLDALLARLPHPLPEAFRIPDGDDPAEFKP
jgi:hypothetical protein